MRSIKPGHVGGEWVGNIKTLGMYVVSGWVVDVKAWACWW